MPLGAGYTAEEQITGEAEHGGLQIMVYPMKREVFEERFPISEPELARFSQPACMSLESTGSFDLGLAPGGRMKQEIYDDPYDLFDWDTGRTSRCFVHIANSLVWGAITGDHPPTVPPTAPDYSRRGLPWFDYYDDRGAAVQGSGVLARLKSVVQLGKEKGDVPLPENEWTPTDKIITIRKGLARHQVREGRF